MSTDIEPDFHIELRAIARKWRDYDLYYNRPPGHSIQLRLVRGKTERVIDRFDRLVPARIEGELMGRAFGMDFIDRTEEDIKKNPNDINPASIRSGA